MLTLNSLTSTIISYQMQISYFVLFNSAVKRIFYLTISCLLRTVMLDHYRRLKSFEIISPLRGMFKEILAVADANAILDNSLYAERIN